MLLGLALAGNAAPNVDMEDVPADTVERAGLLPADVAMLENPSFRWQHLQTAHFIVHHDRKTFAMRVARMGEAFYDAIRDDLPDLHDRMGAQRSHIFIFRNARDGQWTK